MPDITNAWLLLFLGIYIFKNGKSCQIILGTRENKINFAALYFSSLYNDRKS
jgi:hypothetical protein